MNNDIKIGNHEYDKDDENINYYERCKNNTKTLITKLIDLDLSTGDDLMEICEFIKENFVEERLIYSVISDQVYNLEVWQLNDLESANLKLLDYTNNLKNDEQTIKIVTKLADHIDLALAQERYFIDYNKEELNDKINEVDSFMKDVNRLNDNFNSLNSQIISVLGIFTAIAFILFGGISSAASILDKIENISIGLLLIFGGVWGLIIYNTIYFLIYYISKLTTINIKTNRRYNASIFRRHPYICIINYIFLSMTIIGSWFYLIEYTIGNDWMKNLIENNRDFLSFGTVFIFVVIIIVGGWIIYKISDSSHDY